MTESMLQRVLRCSTVALLTAGATPLAGAQEAVIPAPVRLAADRISAEQIARDIEYLASDELRGRNTPSPGLDSAAAYVVRRLQRAGLKPLGDGGTYLQQYGIRESTLDTTGAFLDVDGRRFKYGDHFVLLGFTGDLDVRELPVVYVGRGQVIDSVDVRGKLVLAHPPVTRRIWTQLLSQGAVGMLVLSRPSVLNTWDRRRAFIKQWELEPWVPSAYATVSINTMFLQPDVADLLLEGENVSRADLLAIGDSGATPSPFELRKRVSVRLPVAESALRSASNVVAMLEGADPQLKGEYVTIASHLDGAIDTDPVAGDSIYNAADDNASGSAATLAIAEQLARAPRARRSIIFIWDSGEEQRLFGTRHFVANPPVPLDRIITHFNVDMIGSTRAPGSPDSASVEVTGPDEVYLMGPGVLSAGLDSLLQRVNRSYVNLRYNRKYDVVGNEFFYPRTDGAPFLERGVMLVGVFTGVHDRYHMPADEAPYLDMNKVAAIARTLLASVWVLADSPDPPRADKSWPATIPRF